MLAEQRRNRLLELIRLRRFASLPELAEQLAVSESTVRRDLDTLESQGVGAVGSTGGFFIPAPRRSCLTSIHTSQKNGTRSEPLPWRPSA